MKGELGNGVITPAKKGLSLIFCLMPWGVLGDRRAFGIDGGVLGGFSSDQNPRRI